MTTADFTTPEPPKDLVEALAAALAEVQPPDPEYAEDAAAAANLTVNWRGWAAHLAAHPEVVAWHKAECEKFHRRGMATGSAVPAALRAEVKRLREALAAAHRPHRPTCPQDRYPGNHFEPPDPCECGVEELQARAALAPEEAER